MTVHILGQSKKKCEVCGQPSHPFTTRCDYHTLVRRVKLLLEANACIPSILASNKEALQVSLDYENMMKQASHALTLVEEVVKESEGGEQIWNMFQERLDAWLKTLHPDTAVNPNLSSPESTTPSEIESKVCTEETTPGETTAPDSSPSTENATPVGKEPQSSIT